MGKNEKKKSKQIGRHSGQAACDVTPEALDVNEELESFPDDSQEAELLDIDSEDELLEQSAQEAAQESIQEEDAQTEDAQADDAQADDVQVEDAASLAAAGIVISGKIIPPPGYPASSFITGEDVIADYYGDEVKGFSGERQDSMLLHTPVAEDLQAGEPEQRRAQHAAPDDKINKQPSKGKRIALIVLLAVVVLLVAAYVAGDIYFSSRFCLGSKIGGVEVAGKQVEEVETAIKDHAANYQLTVEGREDFSATIKGADIELAYQDSKKELQEMLDSQNPWSWPLRLLPESWQSKLGLQSYSNYSCELATFNQEKLVAILATLDCFVPEKMRAPANAKVSYSATKKKYEVQKEDLGTTLVTESAIQAIATAVSHLEETVDLDEKDCYQNPEIVSTDESLQTQLSICEEYFPFAQIYTMGTADPVVVDGTTFITWYTVTDEGLGEFNEPAMAEWLNNFAASLNTVGAVRTFTSMDGYEATVSGGGYGWQLDVNQEYAALLQLLADRQTVEREPYWLTTGASHGSYDWGSTYVEVSIPSQTLYYVVDGSVVYSCGVVTGNPSTGHATPQGVYTVNSKQSPSTLVGNNVLQEDGSYAPEYRTTVSYWMAVIGNSIGIHDATWQPYFGGSLYTYNGSHGCINVALDSAGYLYGVLEIGTPVIIHY